MLTSENKNLHELESEMGRIVALEIADFKKAHPSIDRNDSQ